MLTPMNKEERKLSKALTKKMKSDKTMKVLYDLEKKRAGRFWNAERFPLQVVTATWEAQAYHPIINYLHRKLHPAGEINPCPILFTKKGKAKELMLSDEELFKLCKVFAEKCKSDRGEECPYCSKPLT